MKRRRSLFSKQNWYLVPEKSTAVMEFINTWKIVYLFAFSVLTLLPTAKALRTDPLEDSCARDDANCCFAESKWPRNSSRFRCSIDENGSYPCSVKLGVNAWAGSFASVYVAKIFIEEFLGYPVEITADFSDMTGVINEFEMWSAMANREIDAILEYWPSVHRENIVKYTLEEGSVVSAGSNGLIAKTGWYINSFILDTNPELEYWRILKKNLHLFVSNVTERPCCMADPSAMSDLDLPCIPTEADGGTLVAEDGFANYSECTTTKNIPLRNAPFIGYVPSWAWRDNQIIRNLGLNLTMEFVGSEENAIAEIAKAEVSGTPRLFLFSSPHGLFQMYNLTSIILPKNTPECEAKMQIGLGDCDYAIDIVSKAYSTALQDAMPDVALFLDALAYSSNQQQEKMVALRLENSFLSWNDIACDWISNNSETTHHWTSAVSHKFADQVWMSETLQPSYLSCTCEADGSKNVVAVYDKSDYVADGLVEIYPDEDPCSSERSYSVYRTRWATLQYETTVVKTIQCTYIPNGSSEEKVIYALNSMACLVMISCFTLLMLYRKVQAVKSARIRTLSYLLLGAMLMNISCIFDIGPPTSVTCALRFNFLLFGFFLFIGTLLIKQYTINSLMRAKYKLDKKGAKKATIFLRYEFQVCLLFSGICALIWFLAVGFLPIEVVVDTTLGLTEEVCPSSVPLLMLIIAVCYIVIIMSCVLASQARNFPGVIFNEAKFMLFSNYNVAILTAFSLFVSLADGMQPSLQSLFVSLCIFICTTSCALLIVGSRIYAAHYDMRANRSTIIPADTTSNEGSGRIAPGDVPKTKSSKSNIVDGSK